MFANYAWAWGCPGVWFHWRKLTFPSHTEMPMAPQLGVGLRSILLPPYWHLVWVKPVQVLCVLSQSLWIDICISPLVSGRYCFPGDIDSPPLTFGIFPPPPLHRSLSLEGRGLIKTSIPFRAEGSRVSSHQCIVLFGSPC